MYVRTLYTQGCSVSYRGAQTISKHAQVVPSGYNLERQLADKSAAHHANIAASVRACFELTRLLWSLIMYLHSQPRSTCWAYCDKFAWP